MSHPSVDPMASSPVAPTEERQPSSLPFPEGRWHLKETWLTAQPRLESGLVAAFLTFCLALASLVYWQDLFHARGWMPASGLTVFEHHQYYRLWTTLFAHADAAHLASNSFLFFILAYFLYGYFGGWVFPVAAFVLSGLTNLLVLGGYPSEVQLIGASGVVYWMGGAWLMLDFRLSRQKKLTHRILRSLGVGILIFMPAEVFHQEVSYSAHFYGFVTGLIFGWIYFQVHRSRLRAAERYVFEADGPDLEAELRAQLKAELEAELEARQSST